MRLLGTALVMLGILVAGIGGYGAVLLRDGLGPDAVESSGWVAVSRALHVGWPAFVLATALLLGGVVFRERRPT